MAKFSNNDDHALKPAVHFLATIAANAIAREKARSRPTIAPPPLPAPVNSEGHAVEDKFSKLEDYDTVFLIDDSPSMRGEKWELVQRILDYSTTVATRYDPDGIDVHFMNNTRANQDRIKDPEIATKIHHGIELRGNTPTLDRVSRHLSGYIQRFRAENYAADFKGYNLIVLTDGEPSPEYEDESDISDQEDAKKNKAAFRLLRKKIVEVARKLDEVEAERSQVGIQFCQIGNDHDATVFFKYLDDRIKGKHNLRRDVCKKSTFVGPVANQFQMVDTVPCQSELDLTEQFFEKLLLGAIDKSLDRKQMEANVPANHSPHTAPAMSHRPKMNCNGKERQYSDDDTLVGSSTRWNSLHGNRVSTMRTLNESPIDEVSPSPTYGQKYFDAASSRRASPPSATLAPPRRHATFDDVVRETEEPEPKPAKRSFTLGSHKSRR